MMTLQGKGVSQGVVSGPLYFFQRPDSRILKRRVTNTEGEKQRLAKAREMAVAQLQELARKCRKEAGSETAILFETHALILEDAEYVGSILETLEREQCNAEYAVQAAGERCAAMFTAMDDAYMQERSADIRDVTQRLLNILMDRERSGTPWEEPVVLAAQDLSPSETIQLDKSRILGFAMQGGSDKSHTAILARTLGIPAVCGLGEALKEEYQGLHAYMNGETGQVILDPDEKTLRSLTEQCDKQQKHRDRLLSMKGKEDVTLDGQRVDVYCNIGSPEDVEAVLANDGQGIGLFRSEFLYLAAKEYPTEDQQFQAYRSVAETMKGRRVIIRTLDIGADKQVEYFHLPREENPALGMRAIRICLNQPEIFRCQLRALYRASAYGNVAILLPMITSVWEVQECLKACRNVMKELRDEGIPFNSHMEIGIMIETPASVLIAEELAGLVDFFSVGTNDLTQYILACDRQCNDLGRFFDSHHPAVLRALQMAADAAHKAGIRIGICGELAADTALLPDFLKMGIDELSVAPSAVLPLRAEIRRSRVQ